jgi:type VI secretion system secreted protein VgrG
VASSRLIPVSLSFQGAQESKPAWRPISFDAEEGLSQLFRVTIVLTSDDLTTSLEALLGHAATFQVTRGDAPRSFTGIVSQVEWLGVSGERQFARLDLVPALWSLSKRWDSRIFQRKTVPEILSSVLSAGLKPFKRTLRSTLQRTYPAREYCVQYDEADLSFCLRLMEEEGIGFAFDFSQDAEELVLFDDSAARYPPLPGWESEAVDVLGDTAQMADRESLRHLFVRRALQTQKVVVHGFDWSRPGLKVEAVSEQESHGADIGEHYQGSAPLTWSGYSGTRFASDDSAVRAKLRQEMYRGQTEILTGQSNVTAFVPGYVFSVNGHGLPGVDGKYALMRVHHRGGNQDGSPGVPVLEPERSEVAYSNTFECFPADRPFRPELKTPRPRIQGVQTARVVGAGGEVPTDAHGRIKVQFHWDRLGSRNDQSSCFVRVAQSLAGAGWGSVFLPRIGMEVLVQFVEGDPDRPVVLGCLYNGELPTPYDLPGESTRTVLRTNSSPGGNGYNELSFEDNAGAEEVYLQAQRRLRILVKDDKKQEVLGNETLKVTKDRARTVDGNQNLRVASNDLNTVGANHSLDVGGDDSLGVTGNQSVSVGGNQTVGVAGNRTSNVTGVDQLNVLGAASVNVGLAMGVVVGGVLSENVGGARVVEVVGALSETVGQASLKSEGGVEQSAGQDFSITATGNLTMSSKKNIQSTADKNHDTSAKKIKIEATDGLLLKVGDSSIEISKNGEITLKGKKFHLDVSGDAVVSGQNIKLN